MKNILLLLIAFMLIFSAKAQQVIFSEDFDSGAPAGWTVGAISGTLSWAHGQPQGGRGSSSSAYADPTTDHTTSNTNNYVYGQGLSSGSGDGVGGYYDNANEYLQTPAIDCSGKTGITLTFWRWANFETNYDEAYVEISTDGTNWQDLGQPLYPKDASWTEVTIDISSYADGNSNVYIRWRMESDGSVTYSGWNIDDVTITADCPNPPLEPEISAYPAQIQIGDDVLLDGQYNSGILHWYTDGCKNTEVDTGQQITTTPQGTVLYYAAVEDENGCYSECDTVKVIVAQPCDITAYGNGQYDTIKICSGDNVDIYALGGCAYLMDDNFDSGTLSVGWSSNASPMFNNPCGDGPDSTTYLWIGSASSFPRELITRQYSVSDSCQICFDMRYAEQTGNTGTDCEGPDLSGEGVHIQWSTDDGNTWTDIAYYDPNGGHDPQLINWNHYCLDVPAAAAGDNTRFRFFQDVTSGNDYDHWGLDNVEISCPTPNQTIQWSHGPTVLDPPTDVSPTTTTSYTIVINDGYDPSNSDTSIIVVDVLGTPHTSDVAACSYGASVTFTATGGNNFNWYDAATGGNLLGTGSTYTISSLTSDQTVYVEKAITYNTIDYTFDSDMDGWIAENPCTHTSYNWSWTSDGGIGALYASDPYGYSEQLVHSPIINVSAVTGNVTLEYNHYYDTEDYYDEGIVVYRLDGGNWQQFTPTTGSYPDQSYLAYKISDNTCNSEQLYTYNGTNSSYEWHSSTIDVSSASQLEIGFLLTSDGSVSKDGWYIDEVKVSGLGVGVGVCPNSRAEATAYLRDVHVSTSVTPPSCYGNNDGEITAEAVDGSGIPLSGIFTYNWSTGATSQSISNLSTNTYDITITDQYNCSDNTSVTMPDATTPTDIATTNGASGDCNIVSPNDWVYIVDQNDNTKVIAAVFDASGGNDLYNTEAEAEISSTVQQYNGEYYLQRVTRVTPVSQGPADVRIYFTQDEFNALRAADPSITSINDLAVTKCDESGTWQNCMLLSSTFNNSDIGTGYYAEVSVSSFSKFYIHKNTNYPLPVTLKSFTAECVNSGVLLKWTTTVEINNSYFEILKSNDGFNFTPIASIDGNGNTNKEINYSYVDNDINSLHSYYKLVQYDYDGKSAESKIISSNCDDKELFVKKQQDKATITFVGYENGYADITITNSIGQILLKRNIYIQSSVQKENVDISKYKKGIYYLTVRANLSFKTIKIVND